MPVISRAAVIAICCVAVIAICAVPYRVIHYSASQVLGEGTLTSPTTSESPTGDGVTAGM